MTMTSLFILSQVLKGFAATGDNVVREDVAQIDQLTGECVVKSTVVGSVGLHDRVRN